MKINKFNYSVSSSFQIRSPLFPFELIEKLVEKENSLSELIDFTIEHPFLLEAILIASPQLYDTIIRYDSKKISYKKKTSLKNSLYRYIIRSSTRCTPYGIFAGVSVGKYSNSTCIIRQDISNLKRLSQLDVGIQMRIVQYLLSDISFKNHSFFFPNNSLYKVNDHLRYLKQNDIDGTDYSIEGVGISSYLLKILNFIKEGKVISEISIKLIDFVNDISEEESIEYIEMLISNNLIISEWSLSTNQQFFLTNVIEKLSKKVILTTARDRLMHLEGLLKKIDKDKINTLEERKKIRDSLKFFNIETNNKNLINVDTYIPLKSGSLNKKIAFQTLRVMKDLNQIFPSSKNGNLNRFKIEFKKRYNNEEIPLSVALDQDLGLKYSRDQKHSEIFNFFSIGSGPSINSQSSSTLNWSPTVVKLNELVQAASRNSQLKIVLNPKEFPRHEDINELPNTFSALIELYSENSQDVIHFKLAFAQSAAKMFSRFNYLDKEQELLVTDIIKKENQLLNNKIAAEIIHIPDTLASSILQKPRLRTFEIPIGTLSHLPNKYQIPISDLLISIKGDDFILTSKKLKKQIVPFMSSAHNFKNNPLPIYHFLCDLSTQNIKSRIGFDWGCLDVIYDFLPRVLIGKVIVSKARWRLSNEPVLKIFKECETSQILKSIKNWRINFSIPTQINLKEGDKLLFFDFEKQDLVMTFYDSIKSKKTFILEECYLNKKSPVRDEDNLSYANELVIPFFKN